MKIMISFLLVAALSSCVPKQVDVPPVTQNTPVAVANARDLASVRFDRVGFKIRRGTVIGSYEPSVLGLTGCVNVSTNIFWNQGRVLSRDVEFSDIFFTTLQDANFNVVGDPNLMFANATDRKPEAEFLVGGQIEDIKLNVCEVMDFWTGFSNGTQRGKGSVSIRWQVFSNFERKVVYETMTEGLAEITESVAGGEILIIQEAFASATDNLIPKQEFVDLLKDYKPTLADVKSLDKTEIRFERMPESDSKISENIDDTRLAVVSVDSGRGGHGSGFFVTNSLILTNHHVVGEAEFVRVNLLTGRKIIGNVLRSHPVRDIALIQVEPTAIIPLPIREKPLNVAEEVYAIGSPLEKDLSGTVTKGIVSKFQLNDRGLEDIQADVDIQGGNSGGPLLDANGNVVGISYAGIGVLQLSAGVNFFIPIHDGLKRLNVTPMKKIPNS
ncbi:MAG: serine protease [Rhodospirillales bacterium]|nr:serine protease [Rhodospirillales bacterium]